MSTTRTQITGTVDEHGRLQLDRGVALPPGRAHGWLDIETPEQQPTGDIMVVLEEIWATQRARGDQPRSAEEIDAEINALRDEVEEQLRELDELQAAGRSEVRR